MIDLKHVATFVSVAQSGRFSRAADLLDLAQPTVSAHIKSLEKELGYDLFDRIGKYAVMSSQGKQFLPYANELLELATKSKAVGKTDKPISGRLTVCIVQSVCSYRMPAILQSYHQHFPNVQVKIIVARSSTYMLEPLRKGKIDAAVVLEAPFDIPSLASKTLWSETLQLVVPPNHPLSNVSQVNFDYLQNEFFILPEEGAHYRKLFERRAKDAGFTPNVAFEIHSLDAIKRCVSAGVGVAILPTFAIEDELARGELIGLPFEGRKLKVDVQMIWHKEKQVNAQTQAFLDLMIKQTRM